MYETCSCRCRFVARSNRRGFSRRSILLQHDFQPAFAERQSLRQRFRRSKGARGHLLHLAGSKRRLGPAARPQRGSFQFLGGLPSDGGRSRPTSQSSPSGRRPSARRPASSSRRHASTASPMRNGTFSSISPSARRSSKARRVTRSAPCRSCRGRSNIEKRSA